MSPLLTQACLVLPQDMYKLDSMRARQQAIQAAAAGETIRPPPGCFNKECFKAKQGCVKKDCIYWPCWKKWAQITMPPPSSQS
jgi:hypothetical protein